jgi:hypothetical protein
LCLLCTYVHCGLHLPFWKYSMYTVYTYCALVCTINLQKVYDSATSFYKYIMFLTHVLPYRSVNNTQASTCMCNVQKLSTGVRGLYVNLQFYNLCLSFYRFVHFSPTYTRLFVSITNFYNQVPWNKILHVHRFTMNRQPIIIMSRGTQPPPRMVVAKLL